MGRTADGDRERCFRCWRPLITCWCAAIPDLPETKTKVIIVQHPREADTAIGTARMTHLALKGSRLVEGIYVDAEFKDGDLDGAAVLFPGDDARPLEQWLDAPPKKLVVIDGSWSQAKKLLKLNPKLQALPKLSYDPPAPGNYRIRKEPTDKHLSTIEATAAVLGALEGDPERFSALLQPFNLMVDRQIAHAETHQARRRRDRSTQKKQDFTELVALDRDRCVVVFAEANCHPQNDRAPGAPEVIHLIASRPLAPTRPRHSWIIKPRRPLHPDVGPRLGLRDEQLLNGVDIDVALAEFDAFVEGGSFVCWGPFARDVLMQEGRSKRGFIDMRALVARKLRRQGGGIDKACAALDVEDIAGTGVRAERMHDAVVALLRRMLVIAGESSTS